LGILKKLAGQSAIYGLSSIVGRFLNYLLVPLHTNIFTNPGQYGVVTEIYAYISFLMIVYTFGMETTFFHFSEKHSTRKANVFATGMSVIIAVTLFFSGSMIMLAEPLAQTLRYGDHTEYVIWMALILGLDSVTALPFARLRQQDRPNKFAAIKLLNIGTNIFFNLLFFVILPTWLKKDSGTLYSIADALYNPSTGVGYVFIANLLASVVTLLVLIPELRFSRKDFDSSMLSPMIVYSLPLLLAGLAGMVNETLDRIMIKYLIPESEKPMVQLGIYGACYKLSMLMTLFIQAFRYAAEPFFFSQFKNDDAKKTYAVVMKYFTIVCSIIFLGIMMYIDIIRYFIGKTYWEGLHVVPILLIANLCLGIFFNLSMWYKLTGKTRFGAGFALLGAIITILANIILIPKMGYEGAAWATLICYFSMMVASYLTGQKYYPIPYDKKKIAGLAGLSVALYLLTVLLYNFITPDTGYRILINTIVFVFYLFVITRYERPPVH
jgi:O-antigen/teichoic acid export membrane protein